MNVAACWCYITCWWASILAFCNYYFTSFPESELGMGQRSFHKNWLHLMVFTVWLTNTQMSDLNAQQTVRAGEGCEGRGSSLKIHRPLHSLRRLCSFTWRINVWSKMNQNSRGKSTQWAWVFSKSTLRKDDAFHLVIVQRGDTVTRACINKDKKCMQHA